MLEQAGREGDDNAVGVNSEKDDAAAARACWEGNDAATAEGFEPYHPAQSLKAATLGEPGGRILFSCTAEPW